ncbi:metabotropic glutamate receptor 4, putative [Babesia ovata]|uniref:Metabotropic glutamate receptor 4, putative n=1 Tax=Babesia ovata TaxID=189622 RepID=A0A2H6K843_9APIC|nr:metabotropic glutamate receptor 4, putative [Babesia ovata]GBE59172.1 metabotropic glutamate receptor 4, putative [Babesia ovata]
MPDSTAEDAEFISYISNIRGFYVADPTRDSREATDFLAAKVPLTPGGNFTLQLLSLFVEFIFDLADVLSDFDRLASELIFFQILDIICDFSEAIMFFTINFPLLLTICKPLASHLSQLIADFLLQLTLEPCKIIGDILDTCLNCRVLSGQGILLMLKVTINRVKTVNIFLIPPTFSEALAFQIVQSIDDAIILAWFTLQHMSKVPKLSFN